MKINFKLCAPLNLPLLALTFAAPLATVDAPLLIPARILFFLPSLFHRVES